MNFAYYASPLVGKNLKLVIDSALWMRQKGGHRRMHPSYGNRRKDTAHCRRHSIFRADGYRMAAWCEKRPVNILRQSDFWLDDCRLGICNDMGNDRTQRTSYQSSFLDRSTTDPVPAIIYPMPPKFINKSQVAQLFGVSKGTIERWLRDGKLPQPRRRFGWARWNYEELAALLKNKART
jgi:excisionase family DNA binding protein